MIIENPELKEQSGGNQNILAGSKYLKIYAIQDEDDKDKEKLSKNSKVISKQSKDKQKSKANKKNK